MSGYADLVALGVVFRPPFQPLPVEQGVPSPFSAPWSDTVDILAAELRHLHAARIAVDLALTEGDLRLDGIPRSGIRLASDAVRISFESARYGPLMYETGRFRGWQANVRAIALGLEALRRVDRYGITRRGEQYAGWRQLPSSTDPADAIQTSGDETAQRAREILGV